MPNYVRSIQKGGTFFFTVVTFSRRPILTTKQSRDILRDSISEVKSTHPFEIDAWILLPDHRHSIWTLPDSDHDFSKRWGLIKARFSKKAKRIFHREQWMNPSKTKHSESTIWQRRFWEHQIRDEADFNAHINYLHYNPVKHRLVKRVADWPYSTFHKFVRQGVYPMDWGGDTCNEESDLNFGE